MVDPLKIFWVLTNSTYLVTKFIRSGIADDNDNGPYFDKTIYEVNVDENMDLQHTILTATAKSHDEPTNIRYEITSGNIGGVFNVNNTTGAVFVAGTLDYETRKRYELRLMATENLKENYTTVIVHVNDVNDNPPIFERTSYRTQITEEDDRNLPKRVIQVKTNDGDKERPPNVIYFLTGPGIDPDDNANSKFDINRTSGEIYVLKPLNRDQPSGRAQWRFTVFAQDEGGEGLVGYADVQISLKDINDNAPIFKQNIYNGNVTENGTAGMVVMTMSAVDYDDPNEGTNAKLVYSIEKNVIEEDTGTPIFEIEPTTGIIKTAVCCLDREKTPDYSIQVVAMDGGGLKGTGTASVRVIDVNDMPPHFTKDEWFTEVDETDTHILPETPILTVTVHDDDETNHFFYTVVEDSGYGADKFQMIQNPDGTGSLKIKKPLNYEDQLQRNGFRFKIQVNDNGDSKINKIKNHAAFSWVVVKLRDINDNEPQFKRNHIEIKVYENVQIGKILETFKATDPDEGGRSQVSYAIDRTTDKKRQFAINEKGIVTVQRALDREVTAKHHLRILAIDDGEPQKTSTATLNVIVQDINDNAPRFYENYRPVVPENDTPKKIIQILAVDDDDRQKGNGPPFQFRLDTTADDIIRTSFKVEQDDKGDGMAIISSLRSFDRELQKEYHIPIVIKDHGSPPLTGTNTLTVIIGDENDHEMLPSSKEIFVYNFQGTIPTAPIGRIYVYDLDDWDLPDKKFYWDGQEHSRFKLDGDTGMLSIRQGTRDGRYHLKFKVYDRKYSQIEVPANATVIVRKILQESVLNSGSIRITGISDEDFIRVWNYKTRVISRSKYEKFKDKLASLFHVDKEKIEIFSVQSKINNPTFTDVRFSIYSIPPYNSVRLNGIVLMHREEIEKDIGINITMVGIDECLYESQMCDGSCTNLVKVNAFPYLVNANKTSLAGLHVDLIAKCTCGARNINIGRLCKPDSCYNSGKCIESRYDDVSCICPIGFTGPRCQQVSRSFRGNGWAWYDPLELCQNSHLSIEFITRTADGLILYNGPIVPSKKDETIISDFISVELEKGLPRLLIDFGSGTLELRVKTKMTLDDGEWHRLDIFWDTEEVRMVVDHCKSAEISELEDGTPTEMDNTSCQSKGLIPPFNEFLNLNTPLQLGGLYGKPFDPTQYHWQHIPNSKGFDGCIRNLIHNSRLYDLGQPGMMKNSLPGCPQTERICSQSKDSSRCSEVNGNCVGSFSEAKCECNPGWTGPTCSISTIPSTLRPQSYVKYALSFEPDRYSTQIQLRFRTRELNGELFRLSDQHSREYGILGIENARLYFRYNLNSLRIEETNLWLKGVSVDDGHWHVVRVNRYGSTASLELDGGEGVFYNETLSFKPNQWLLVDKQEGVYAGGKAEYTDVKTFEVLSDYQNSCLDDIRLNGKHLPLPPTINGTQWGQATMARNLERYCHSNKPCASVVCPDPFECIDLWNKHDCTCGEGRIIAADGRNCADRNECLDLPCQNGGTCINLEPRLRYRCLCTEKFWGDSCELIKEAQMVKLSIDASAAILVCLLIVILLVPIYIICSKKKEANVKQPPTKVDDVRENIINYDDEGGGEDDMTAFDITPLQIPVGGPIPDIAQCKMSYPLKALEANKNRNVRTFIEIQKKRVDNDNHAPPFDDLRNYAYEGDGSNVGSLSSLASETDDEVQDFQFITSWGPRFDQIATMYTSTTTQPSENSDKTISTATTATIDTKDIVTDS